MKVKILTGPDGRAVVAFQSNCPLMLALLAVVTPGAPMVDIEVAPEATCPPDACGPNLTQEDILALRPADENAWKDISKTRADGMSPSARYLRDERERAARRPSVVPDIRAEVKGEARAMIEILSDKLAGGR